MSTEQTDRPWAPEETEQRVREIFPLDMLPEEFAARDGYGWMDFPFSQYRYRDASLDAWIQRVGEIITTPALMKKYQNQYLTFAEKLMMKRYMEDDDERLDGD